MQCDQLTVAIDGDERVRSLKGEGRPLHRMKDRADALYLFNEWLDVRSFHDADQLRWIIGHLKPDVIFKGSDYEGKEVIGSDLARVVLIPRLAGFSTTEEIRKRA
jgi:D-beta-D-heptose 7-phosphate kinase/D-beta-D-heptose 1-phosphate adenosyltransferase